MSPITARKYKTRPTWRRKSSKLWETARISKARCRNTIQWSPRSLRKRESSCMICTTVQSSRTRTPFMKNLRKATFLNKTNTCRPIELWKNTSILKMRITAKTQSTSVYLTAWRRRDSSRQFLMREGCSWVSCRGSTSRRRESCRLWTGLKRILLWCRRGSSKRTNRCRCCTVSQSTSCRSSWTRRGVGWTRWCLWSWAVWGCLTRCTAVWDSSSKRDS